VLWRSAGLCGLLLLATGCFSTTPTQPHIVGTAVDAEGTKISNVEVALRTGEKASGDLTVFVKDGMFYVPTAPAGTVTVYFKVPPQQSAEYLKSTGVHPETGAVTGKIPPKYHNPKTSGLTFQVNDKGETKIDIKLEAK